MNDIIKARDRSTQRPTVLEAENHALRVIQISTVEEGGVAQAYDTLVADTDEGYAVGITVVHHKIHESKHYICDDYDSDVDIASPKYWLINVPDGTYPHMFFRMISSLNGFGELFENPTITDNGTEIDSINNNRNSANASNLNIYRDPTVSSDGTRIMVAVFGSDATGFLTGSSGAGVQEDKELILKTNEQYLIKFTALTDDCRVSMELSWYE